MRKLYKKVINKAHLHRRGAGVVDAGSKDKTDDADRSLATEAERPSTEVHRDDKSQNASPPVRNPFDEALKKLQTRQPWEEAYNAIQESHPGLINAYTRALLESGGHTGDKALDRIQEVQALAQEQLEVWQSEQFRLSFNGKDVIVGELARKVVGVVLSVKDVVSSAISADPHAALAWAGVMVALPVLANILKQDSDAMSGLDAISALLVRYRYVEEDKYYRAAMTSATSVDKTTRDSLDRDLESVTNGMIFEIGSKVDNFSKMVEDLKKELRNQTRLMSEQRDRILRAFKYSTMAPFDSFKNAEEPRCLKDTQVETLDMLQNWCKGDGNPVLWLHGMAGTGKSTIARTIAWALQDRQWPDGSSVDINIRLGGSFFFNQFEPERNNSQYLFPTLTQCLAESLPDIRQYIVDAIDQDARIEEKGLRVQWASLISGPLHKLTSSSQAHWRFIMIVDSLDECGDQDKVATVLKLLASLRDLPSVRFLITSRPEAHIRFAFESLPPELYHSQPLHKISPKSDDITRFLEADLKRIWENYNSAIPEGWPGQENIEKLKEKSDGLFVYASTCCRFLEDPYHYSSRLDQILKDDSEAETPQAKLDEIYIKIIEMSLNARTKKEREIMIEDFRLIVGTIMVIFKPASASTLEALLFSPSSKDKRIQRCVEPLKSLLDVRAANDPIRPVHLSLRDLLLSRERCKSTPELYINPQQLHLILFERCMETMKSLKQDLCDLVLPGSSPSDVPSEKVETFIPAALCYACRYWIDHLMQLGSDEQSELLNDNGGIIECFLRQKLLCWFEALSLMGELEVGVFQLSALQGLARDSHYFPLFRDARRFLLHNRHIIEQAPLQVYSSALIFCPMKSPIKEIYSHLMPSWISQQPIMDDDWSRELFVIETQVSFSGNIIFSPDGKTGASSSFNRDGNYYLKLWNVQTGKVKSQTKVGAEFGFEFSQDGSLIAHGTEDGRVRLWNFETDEEYFLGEVGKGEIHRIAFSPLSHSLIFSRADHSVEVWNYRHCQQIYAPFTQFRDNYDDYDTCAVGFLFNDEAVVLYSSINRRTWEIYLLNEAGTELECIVEGEAPAYTRTNFCVSRNGCRVLVSNQNLVKTWDAKTGRLSPKLIACGETQTGDRDIYTTAFSSGGRFFATSSLGNTVRVWDLVTHTQILSFRCDQGAVGTIALSHDGSLLASCTLDSAIRLWDITVDRPRTELANPEAKMTYPFGIEVITNTQNATTMLRKEDTGSCRFYTEDFESLQFWMQGNLIALILRAKTLNQPTAHLLSMDLEKQSPRVYLKHTRDVIVSSSNGEKLAVLGEEHVWVLDAAMAEEIFISLPEKFYGLQFSPDSQFVGMILSRGVEIWDLKNKKRVILRTELPDKPVLGFSPKSDAVALWVRDHHFPPRGLLLEVWQISGHPSQQVNERTSPSDSLHCGSLIYSADGDYIVMLTLRFSGTASHNSTSCTLVLLTYNLATGLIENIPCAAGLYLPDGPMAAWSDLIATAPTSRHEELIIVVINCKTGERVCTFYTSLAEEYLGSKEISFSNDGRYLNLDRGQVLIPVKNRSPTTEMYCPSSLWIGKEWIFQRGRKLLWISPVFRNRRMSVQYDEIWVYPEYGKVGPIVFFKLDLGKTPFAAEVPPEGEGFHYDEQERVMYLR
ncbi:hypothetical protein ASPTUDRAFT_31955 [Aspergillus tubingensis CBS 134.48]|uniref:NACHT domain-containing protein n=1 Tax=Aspergillus tubingensis (strain CBS 134.48) TaxID=767770 RepID=A0A1L9MYQ3_ASPTC|nr:hypothetical protein ASPTUDRAFT_31955 [Aspergillus tubingensis CBS 134.48]